MKLTKIQAETWVNLQALIQIKGKPWVLGWALGTILRLSQHDPQLRRMIASKLRDR